MVAAYYETVTGRAVNINGSNRPRTGWYVWSRFVKTVSRNCPGSAVGGKINSVRGSPGSEKVAEFVIADSAVIVFLPRKPGCINSIVRSVSIGGSGEEVMVDNVIVIPVSGGRG